jgi:hypothetical protein
MSALPLKADMLSVSIDVRFVPCVDGSWWQVKTSRCVAGRCSHVFGLLERFA